MKESILREKSLGLGASIIQAYTKFLLPNKDNTIAKQVLRSATSVGANINEAGFAISKADFISKLHIALKECNETLYWLELILRVQPNSAVDNLLQQTQEINAMLIASLNTAKKNQSQA